MRFNNKSLEPPITMDVAGIIHLFSYSWCFHWALCLTSHHSRYGLVLLLLYIYSCCIGSLHILILLPLIVYFPGMFENFIFGQNGFLCGIFLGSGLLLLDSSPLAAGILFGLLSFKPHFFILVLIAFIFGRYWKALIGTIITTIALSLISLLVFGPGVWSAYLNTMSIPMHLLEMGAAAWSIMPTFFAATLSLGFGVRAAYLVQGLAMLMVLTGVAWVWMRKANLALRGSVLTLGLLLFTPYAFIYDLSLLALPLCWLWEEGHVRGRLPGELILLLCGWLMPFAAPLLWNPVNIFDGKLQIGPVVLLALFLLSLARPISSKIGLGRRTRLKPEKA